jgi:hypothetical protein
MIAHEIRYLEPEILKLSQASVVVNIYSAKNSSSSLWQYQFPYDARREDSGEFDGIGIHYPRRV